MKKIVGKRIFFHSLRTAIVFVAGFIIYEILIALEKEWNKKNPGKETYNFHKRNILKFIFIFLVDFIVLYVFFWLFDTLL
jgi:hypothetical protein